MRVLHVGKFFPPHRGGMEIFLADLITAQQDQGIDAHALVHGTPRPDDPHWLERIPVQFTVTYAPMALGFRRALDRAIRRLQPDILHLHMPNNSALWVLTLTSAHSVPWVVHWQSDVVVSKIRSAVALAYQLYRPFEQALLRRSARIIVTSPPYLQCSEPLRAWHDRCAVVPLGLGSVEARPDTAAADTPHWHHDALRLLSIGRLTYYKGFETLIQAVARMPNVQLLIIGEGELRGQLQALIDAVQPSDRPRTIRLLGNVDDEEKHALLAQCDVFCLASRERTEAFGVAILEAMQHAKPCIVSDLEGSGMPWVVQTAGAGLLAPPEDVKAWQTAIAQMQNDATLRARTGHAGQQALQQNFSMATCARRIAGEYALVLPDPVPSPPSKEILIVIPARNEAATIGSVLQSLSAAGWHDVLVVNDQSTDDTGAIAKAAGARVLTPVLPVGAWGGMQAGIRYALRNGYKAVITMDADGQHEVDEIPTLLNARDKADLVIGAFPERASRLRQLAWHWFRQLAGFDLRDLTSGFRLYNRNAMAVLASREATLLDYQDLGALLLVRQTGLRIEEVPVSMSLRNAGKSRIFNSWFSVARYMVATTLLCLARWQTPSSATKKNSC